MCACLNLSDLHVRRTQVTRGVLYSIGPLEPKVGVKAKDVLYCIAPQLAQTFDFREKDTHALHS